jgi:hypothetical protein
VIKKRLFTFVSSAVLLLGGILATNMKSIAPGARVQIMSHNAYPDHGKYTDRLDRTIASGVPFAAEEDLAWVNGKSLLIHGSKSVGSDDPTLETYFFPRVKPIIEKALKEGNKGNWPVVTLYLDIKDAPVEHLEAISAVLDRYDSWLTTARKTADIREQSPLDLKPMMVLVEDKKDGDKQVVFYDRVPVGGKIRVFGTLPKFEENPNHLPRARRAEWIAELVKEDPEKLVNRQADNYRRWFNLNWAFVEKDGQPGAGEWTAASEARLKRWVEVGHRMGYYVGVQSLDGFTEADNQGWDKDYNFGSREKVVPRWKAAVHAHVDFVGTDQVEGLAAVLHTSR